MDYNWIGFVIVFLAGFLLTVGPLSSRFPKNLAQILFAAMLFRALGTVLRYWVMFSYYKSGDAIVYYRKGLQYASYIWRLDFSFLDQAYWAAGHWWGTQATIFASGFVISLVGPTTLGQFLTFSILSFIGLLLLCKVFQKNYPQSSLKGYAAWVLFWPSLWFWPSCVGKDALILVATSLVIYGYASKKFRIQWIPVLAGLALASAIRPQVAGVLIVSVAIAHWITPGRKWGPIHFFQGILILLLTVLVLRQGLRSLGLEDMEDLKGYIEMKGEKTTEGGSQIGAPGLTITAVPIAIVNVLFRPFPWEAGNVLALAASLEMILFWCIVLIRRRRILRLLREWRFTRLLRLAVPLTILYVVLFGMAAGNLGIIVRQRIHILPLLLLWLEAQPLTVKVPQQVARLPRLRLVRVRESVLPTK